MSGPFFEDLPVRWQHRSAGYQITTGHVAAYQAISGDQGVAWADPAVAARLGWPRPAVNPALLAHVAIAQSTPATREVVANLYYRDVRFAAFLQPGSAVSTTTTVLARKWGTSRPDRAPRGTVLLEMTSTDDQGRTVATMRRLALVRARAQRWEDAPPVGPDESIEIDRPVTLTLQELADTGSASVRAGVALPPIGEELVDPLAEPVTDAVALVRLVGNVARAHRDPAHGQQGRRLVYGGHTLALAQASISRLLDDRAVVLGWLECSHPAPVFEQDLLTTSMIIEETRGHGWGTLLRLRVSTTAGGADGEPRLVQVWRPVVCMLDR